MCGRRGADVRPTPLRAPHQARRRFQRDTFHIAGTKRCPVGARSRCGRYIFRRCVFASHRYSTSSRRRSRIVASANAPDADPRRASGTLPEGFRLRRHAPPPRASGKRLFTRGDHRTTSPATSRRAPNPSLCDSTACSAARGWTRRPAVRPSGVTANKNGPPALRRWQPGGPGDRSRGSPVALRHHLSMASPFFSVS